MHRADQRTQRTRHWIIQSFNRLFLSRSYDKFDASDIAERAGVGRSTFYEHFRGKDAVLADASAWVLGVLADAADEHGNQGPLERVLDHFVENRAIVLGLMTGSSAALLHRQLADLWEAKISELARDRALEKGLPARLTAVQLAESQLGVIREWLETRDRYPNSELAAALRRSALALVASHWDSSDEWQPRVHVVVGR